MEETIQQKTGSVKDILNILNKVNETFAYEVYVPSLNKYVLFRQINTSQQKRLLKAIIDSPAYNTEFIYALKAIIEENCVENIDINNLTIYDKMIIALSMRAMSIGNEFDIRFTVPVDDGSKEIVRKILLKDLIDKALEVIKIEPIVITDDKNVYTVYCSLPTISEEYKLEKELRNKTSSIEIKSENQLRETIGEVFINEIVKYIKKINIKNDGEMIEIDLKEVSFKDRLEIIGKLPVLINKNIIGYINNVNKEFEKVLLFKEQINGKTVEQRLSITADFFTVS